MKEVVYSVDEYALHPEVLGTSVDMIRAAFVFAGKNEAGIKEARKIIRNFKNREVK